MSPAENNASSSVQVSRALENFVRWLDRYGEKSWDHQSFFAGPLGRRAKGLYYKNKLLGTAAVAPMIFCEAFFPPARRLFHEPMRLPIADAHYAMGFAFLHEAAGDQKYLDRAVHFLDVLKASRSPGYENCCWGYPFDWVTRNGVLKAHLPFITTTPYVFEALMQVNRLQPRDDWREMMLSAVRFATDDIRDKPFANGGNTCSYMPGEEFNVVNASAYRATMLVSAAKLFGNSEWLKIAAGNVDFVLAAQNPDGSWPYAKDGVRNFVDHFHTCFVMKALAKIYLNFIDAEPKPAVTPDLVNTGLQPGDSQRQETAAVSTAFTLGEKPLKRFSASPVNSTGMKPGANENSATGLDVSRISVALSRGVDYYVKNLFGEDGMPRPFSVAPRLTVYKCELYDCAESVNLCLLLRKDFPQLEKTLETVVNGILENWVKPDGSFRSRKLMFGWDNVPMHRWAQSQMFRALAFYLRSSRGNEAQTPKPIQNLVTPAAA